MTEWTEAMVEEVLCEAARARRFLDRRADPAVPSPNALARVGETRGWMGWLELDDADLVSMRSAGSAWKPICWRLGMSRPTAHRHWKSALRLIAGQLNSGAARPSGKAEDGE